MINNIFGKAVSDIWKQESDGNILLFETTEEEINNKVIKLEQVASMKIEDVKSELKSKLIALKKEMNKLKQEASEKVKAIKKETKYKIDRIK